VKQPVNIDLKSCLKMYVFPAVLVLVTLMVGGCKGTDGYFVFLHLDINRFFIFLKFSF